MEGLSVGDIITNLKGKEVYFPFDLFKYRVTKIEKDKISLEIYEAPDVTAG